MSSLSWWGRVNGSKSISGRELIGASFVMAVGLCVLGTVVAIDLRHTIYEQARTASRNVASILEADIARNIELYDLSLQATVDGLQRPDIDRVNGDIRQLILFDRSATAKHLGRIVVLDENGKVRFSSNDSGLRQTDRSQTDYFRAHKSNPEAGLYIGRPFVTANGNPSIGISRRLSHPDGSFAGVVVGTLRLSYFKDLFSNVTLEPGSAIGLIRTDGSMLMRVPFSDSVIGRDMSSSEVLRKAETTYSGDFESVAKIGGQSRLYTFTRVGVFPLVLTVGVSSGPIYAGWRRQAWYIGAVVLILAAATIGLAMFAARELRKRTAVESELALLATTDSLTGLYNRRIFDDSLAREWQRAIRDRTSLSLLMIDADNFKEYNDRYGHQAGDDVLAAIAICVGGSVRSVPDLAARYGGEEFAILLPGSSLHEALEIAERVHASLTGLTDSIRSGSPVPTVSIGVASCEPSLSHDANELVAIADRALYSAKKNGRNRTECGGAVPGLGRLVTTAAA